MKILLSNTEAGNFDVVSPMEWTNDKGYTHPLISVQGVRSLEGDKVKLWISLNLTVPFQAVGETLVQTDGRHVFAHGSLEMTLSPEIQSWLNKLQAAGYQIGTRIKLEKGSSVRLGYIQAEAIALEISDEPRTKKGASFFVIDRIGSVGSLEFTSPSGKVLKNEQHASMEALVAAFS